MRTIIAFLVDIYKTITTFLFARLELLRKKVDQWSLYYWHENIRVMCVLTDIILFTFQEGSRDKNTNIVTGYADRYSRLASTRELKTT